MLDLLSKSADIIGFLAGSIAWKVLVAAVQFDPFGSFAGVAISLGTGMAVALGVSYGIKELVEHLSPETTSSYKTARSAPSITRTAAVAREPTAEVSTQWRDRIEAERTLQRDRLSR